MNKEDKDFEKLSLLFNFAIWGVVIILIFITTKIAFTKSGELVDNLLDDSDEGYIEYTLVLEEDTKYNDVLKILEDEGIIYSDILVKFSNFIRGAKHSVIPAGEYYLNNKMEVRDINLALTSKVPSNSQIQIDIPSGLKIEELGLLLESRDIVTKEEFVQTANTYDFSDDFEWLKGREVQENYLEGLLYPDTYYFEQDATSYDIIYELLSKFEEVYFSSYDEQAKEMNMDLNEVITIASIIEKEISIEEEKFKLSTLIHNRLKNDMNLSMQSTLVYVLNKRPENLNYSDYEIDSPYNTYINKGLPPTPICSPSESSINAVLNPENANYLYFATDNEEEDTHLFTNDYSEIEALSK